MSDLQHRTVLFPWISRAVFLASAFAFLVTPAFAQRGRPGGAAPMGPSPMAVPRMSIPPMSAPMRAPAMPQARPFSRMPTPRFPQPVSRPMMKPQPAARATAVSRAYAPSSAENARRPAYRPLTSASFRSRVAGIRTGQYPHTGVAYISPFYGDPFLVGGGFFIDPFEYAFLAGADCFGYSPFGGLSLDPYSAQYEYPFQLNPAFGADGFCGGPFSPAYFGPFGAFGFAEPLGFAPLNPFVFGLDSSFLDAYSLSSPAPAALTASSADSASLAGLVATSQPNAAFDSAAAGSFAFSTAPGSSSAASNDTAFATALPAQKQPLTLVFSNGLTAQASRYWLGGDSNLHYVTSDGFQMSVPLDRIDLAATMKANDGKGVEFLVPASAGSDSSPNSQ